MQDLNPKKKNKKSQYNKFTGDNIAILHSIRSYSKRKFISSTDTRCRTSRYIVDSAHHPKAPTYPPRKMP